MAVGGEQASWQQWLSGSGNNMGNPGMWSQTLINPSNAKATFVQSTRMQRFLKKHLNPVMLVFIGKLSLSSIR